MKKFICTRGWKRNSTGDIVEEWEYNRYPEEVKSRNFKEHVPVEEVVEEVKIEPVPVKEPVKEPVPVKVAAPSRFKPFNLDDEVSKEE